MFRGTLRSVVADVQSQGPPPVPAFLMRCKSAGPMHRRIMCPGARAVTVQNAEIAAMFEELADLLEIESANPFRVRAYRNAAQFVRGHGRSLADLVEQGADLTALPGIGEDLAGKIRTIVDTGRLPMLEDVRQRVPAPLVEMTRIEGPLFEYACHEGNYQLPSILKGARRAEAEAASKR